MIGISDFYIRKGFINGKRIKYRSHRGEIDGKLVDWSEYRGIPFARALKRFDYSQVISSTDWNDESDFTNHGNVCIQPDNSGSEGQCSDKIYYDGLYYTCPIKFEELDERLSLFEYFISKIISRFILL